MKKSDKSTSRTKGPARKGSKASEEVQRDVREFEERQDPPSGEPHPDPFAPPGTGGPDTR